MRCERDLIDSNRFVPAQEPSHRQNVRVCRCDFLRRGTMPKHLMLSTAAIALMLASGFAYAQAPGERREEPKRTEEPAKGAAPQHGGAAQERVQERAQGAQERLQGAAGRDDKGGARHQAADDKNQPASAAEHNQPNAKDKAKDRDQAQESREPARDRNREAEGAKQERDSNKSSAETKDKSA